MSIMPASAASTDPLAAFSAEISPLNLSPLWERRARLTPGSDCVPAIWPYAGMRPLLDRAATLISKKQAERRVLVMENPSLRGTSFITNSLFAGLQIILPGEVAPAHRHTPSALRFVVEGEGAYTAVGGEKIPMLPGDFIVTPNWSWHDHGNLGTGPVVWMDGLDTPFASLFGAHFRENYPVDSQPLARAVPTMTQGGMVPLSHPLSYPPAGHGAGDTNPAPLLHYPFQRSRAALYQLAKDSQSDTAQGFKLRYAGPAGAYPFATMAAFMQLLPAGFHGTHYRSTDGSVFNVAEGGCRVELSGIWHELRAHDVFVVPPWESHRFAADNDCLLFSFSDRAAQQALGFWREQYLPNQTV